MGEGAGSLPGAPLLTQALDACPRLLESTGHRGDGSCTWCVGACGVAVAGCLVVPPVPVSWAGWGVGRVSEGSGGWGSLLSHACRWA